MDSQPDAGLLSDDRWFQAARSDERKFMEDLVNKRVTVLLTTFGFALTAAGLAPSSWVQTAVLGAMTLLTGMLAIAVSRAQVVFDAVMADIPLTHPTKIAAALVETEFTEAEKTWSTFPPSEPTSGLRLPPLFLWDLTASSRRRIVGYGIPWAIVLLLFLGTVAAAQGALLRSPTAIDVKEACARAAREWESRTNDRVLEVFHSRKRESCVCEVAAQDGLAGTPTANRVVDCLTRLTLLMRAEGTRYATQRDWDLMKDALR